MLRADEKERLTVLDNLDRIPVENPLVLTQQLKTGERSQEIGRFEAHNAEADGVIAVIESRTFIRECIRRSVQSAFPLPVLTYSTAVELEQQHLLTSPKLIIFSWVEDNKVGSINALKVLSELAPGTPVIVLAYNNDSELARTAIGHGAKGYIPVSLGFEVAIEAVRFVLARGPMCQWTVCSREVGQGTRRPSIHRHRAWSQPVNTRSFGRSKKASRIK